MRKNRLAVAILLVMVMLLGIMTTAFAADYTPVDPDDQGKTGIVGGDTLTFTEDCKSQAVFSDDGKHFFPTTVSSFFQ